MAFGVIAGKIVNPMVLFCLFILVAPTGVLMRLANARPLQLGGLIETPGAIGTKSHQIRPKLAQCEISFRGSRVWILLYRIF